MTRVKASGGRWVRLFHRTRENTMTPFIETLIVVADGAGVRAFEEKIRHGPLNELAAWRLTAPQDARHRSSGPRSAGIARHGAQHHAVNDARPAVAAETQFLALVGDRIDREAKAERFNRLILIAPPRALGILRAALGAAARNKIEASDPHERKDATAGTLRERLRQLRAPA
ncbi:MAG TPA: host attachment protein [Caulobacteraceae bacterium]|nr:host attachment protein [Caulobacteraceae bacterium]